MGRIEPERDRTITAVGTLESSAMQKDPKDKPQPVPPAIIPR